MFDPVRLRSLVAQFQKHFSDRMGLTPRHEASVLRGSTELVRGSLAAGTTAQGRSRL